ncbi:MAG: D-amino acid dehydrogenase [Gammaproteobacteria bacterium]
MHCIVVGAGLLGLTTAWFLRCHGVEVTVVERAAGPGLGTSFANGGMLHASQASPWNEPGVLWQALRMLGREDSALLIRPRTLPRMLPWAWQFVRNSRPVRFHANMARNARLAAYSLRVLHYQFGTLALTFERATQGTLKIYRTTAELELARTIALRCTEWDVRYTVLDADGVAALEPALADIADGLSGGIHFPDDVSGDAHLFCRELAAACARAGVTFLYEAEATAVVLQHGQVHGVEVAGDMLPATHCVLAAGSHSARLARRVGLRVPVQPVKGYSLTLPLRAWPSTPRVPVIDEHFHAALCPLGAQLRIAGTAEFAGFDDRLTPSRLENLYTLVRHVYPAGARVIDRREVVHWTGLRPMSPDGVGIMGPTRVPGLHLNTGHGHLGWTMATGAGKLVADALVGASPDIDLNDYSPARFGA